MIRKISRVVFNTILVLLPFFPVLENFFPIVNPGNFAAYLLACGVVWILMLFLAFLTYRTNPVVPGSSKLNIAAYFLFVLGMLVLLPLHMGPPKSDETLLQAATLEQFRYLMLFFAAIFFAAGVLFAVRPFWADMSISEKGILIPLIIAVPVAVWDDYDSGMLSTNMANWIKQGNKAADFFPNYDFHEDIRAIGRILPYVIASWLSIILVKRKCVSKGVFAALNLFCLAGIVFCVLCITKGRAYYFPFMVPAIALAPAYWLGLAWLNKVPVETS